MSYRLITSFSFRLVRWKYRYAADSTFCTLVFVTYVIYVYCHKYTLSISNKKHNTHEYSRNSNKIFRSDVFLLPEIILLIFFSHWLFLFYQKEGNRTWCVNIYSILSDKIDYIPLGLTNQNKTMFLFLNVIIIDSISNEVHQIQNEACAMHLLTRQVSYMQMSITLDKGIWKKNKKLISSTRKIVIVTIMDV
jgi:hypothetical protein